MRMILVTVMKINALKILLVIYHQLKNPGNLLKEPFGDNVTKRMTTITNNKILFQTISKSCNSSWDKNSKNLKRFTENPGNQSQYGHQNKNTGQNQKYCHNNKNSKHSKGKRY